MRSFTLLIVCLLALLACRSTPPPQAETTDTEAVAMQDIPEPELVKQTRPIRLFFAHPTQYGLAVEVRKVFELPDQTAMLKQVLSTLERGPLGDLRPTVPPCLSISNVFAVDDLIYVDLQREDARSQIGGVEGEALFIHSIANTALAVYPKQHYRVRFLVNGAEAETLLGHFDGHQTYTFNREIILQ